MSATPYKALQNLLDQFPLGFPKTESGVEMKILKKLFSPDEAALASRLGPIPEPAADIAKRIERGVEEVKIQLDDMASNGLIFRIRRDGIGLYRAAPFMVGLYEYSIKKIDRDLAALFKTYYDEAYQEEMGLSNIPTFKVIPLERNVNAELTLLPYQSIEESVKNARVIAVTECMCRKESQLLGHACDHPLESCLSFGAAADYYIEGGLGRKISADEAIAILRAADESGLVHAGANAKHLSNICNCCPCCCASMKGMVEKGYAKEKYMNAIFEPLVDEDECTACESCVERCPVSALELGKEDLPVVDRDRCLGCGLCVGGCPTEAITMQVRPDAQEPYDRFYDLATDIIAVKERL